MVTKQTGFFFCVVKPHGDLGSRVPNAAEELVHDHGSKILTAVVASQIPIPDPTCVHAWEWNQ